MKNISLTSSDFDVQSRADERHQSGGEVDGHVLIHRHVHQHQPLTDKRRSYIDALQIFSTTSTHF